MELLKKAAKIDKNSTLYRPRMTKNGTNEIEPNDQMIKENTTENHAGTDEALEMRVVKKAQTSTTNPKLMVYSGLDDQKGHKLQSGCM